MRILILGVVLSFFLFSCNNDRCGGPDVSDVHVDLEVERLDEALFSLESKEDIRQFLADHPVFAHNFIHMDQYPEDSIVVNEIYRLIHDPHIDTLYQETQQAFGDLSELRNQFEDAFRHIKYYYPDFTPPAIYTVFTGLGTIGSDFYISDSLIMVSLEFFLGEEARYRPQVYNYILERYKPEYVVPTTIMLYSGRFNATNMDDEALLADMVFYGKSYYFTQKVLPCLSDSILAGYSEAQELLVENNTRIIWSHFIDNELLYETSHFVKPRYVEERPNTIEISNQVPGRIGRWLGWKIVQAYADRTDASLPEVMKERDARKIFRQSKYKP